MTSVQSHLITSSSQFVIEIKVKYYDGCNVCFSVCGSDLNSFIQTELLHDSTQDQVLY